MTITLHWWGIPLAVGLFGVALLLMVRSEGYFGFPSWHLGVGLMLILVAIAMALGGWLS